jgi:hypothetical protein
MSFGVHPSHDYPRPQNRTAGNQQRTKGDRSPSRRRVNAMNAPSNEADGDDKTDRQIEGRQIDETFSESIHDFTPVSQERSNGWMPPVKKGYSRWSQTPIL